MLVGVLEASDNRLAEMLHSVGDLENNLNNAAVADLLVDFVVHSDLCAGAADSVLNVVSLR